ncbi:uncharacterized protein B0P05DRAFT_568082 [Gilbertella persicaria]|uniref:uncharacterized protein n=1 Tax=Gilbertella persicaria TaxID=101096 RepID=UPI0022207290|nr:uncharacterized protein B0P05DRAFT_568082 [Gilbertella persicaria]KAI8094839.1 hypothetical protein B0P05DRAFT_568082 [Gilbertella persicaria]
MSTQLVISQQIPKSNKFVLSEDEEEDNSNNNNNNKYLSDGDNDDDEHITEPVSAEALELLKTEKVLKSGYLLKKGEKRRTWKKRWFVLRTTKLAMYKDKKEYKLLRIIDLHEIHKVVQVTTKHKYKYVFAFVTAKRMYYVQANDQQDMDDWFSSVDKAKEQQRLYDADDDTGSTDRDQEFAKDVITSYKSNHAANVIQNTRHKPNADKSPPIDATKPMDIPTMTKQPSYRSASYSSENSYPLSPNSDHQHQLSMIEGVASSEDDEEYSVDKANIESEENRNRVLIEGYLLKLGRNKGWRKRWFVLRTDTLAYYEDDKEYSPHRIIPLHHIIDSLEIDPISKSKQYCFKIIIPKRSYVLCASSEADMDSWLNALVVAIKRAKKDAADVGLSPVTPHPYNHQRTLSLIPENSYSQTNSTSEVESFENVSHISGVSGACGCGGAGGALGAGTSTTNSLVQLHSRASEQRFGCAK